LHCKVIHTHTHTQACAAATTSPYGHSGRRAPQCYEGMQLLNYKYNYKAQRPAGIALRRDEGRNGNGRRAPRYCGTVMRTQETPGGPTAAVSVSARVGARRTHGGSGRVARPEGPNYNTYYCFTITNTASHILAGFVLPPTPNTRASEQGGTRGRYDKMTQQNFFNHPWRRRFRF
jgi:hypothetical protein